MMMMMSNKIAYYVRACVDARFSSTSSICSSQMCELHFKRSLTPSHISSLPLWHRTTNFIAIIIFRSLFASTIPNVIAFYLSCDDVDSWHEHRLHGSFLIISIFGQCISFVVYKPAILLGVCVMWCGVVLCGLFGSHPIYIHWPTEWMEVNYRRTNARTNECEERNKLIKLMLNEMRTSKRWNGIIIFLSNHTKKVCVCASKIHRIQTSDVDVFAFSFCSAQLHLTVANTAATATTATASAENDSDSKRYSVSLIVLPISRL